MKHMTKKSLMFIIMICTSFIFMVSAGDPGELPEDELFHFHTMNHYAAVEPTTTTDGHIEYWYCTGCKKYFSDSAGTKVISQKSTVIPATGSSKKANTLAVKVSSKTYKRSALKKARSFNIGATGKGKITYTRNAAAKKARIKVSSQGKVTVPKKCKKGTYKITVNAAGNSSYKSGKKTVTIRIK